jgi:cytochrome P450
MSVAVGRADLDPAKVHHIALGSAETKQAMRSLAAEWGQSAPFYVPGDRHVSVVVGRHADALEVYQDRDRFSTAIPAEPGYGMYDKFMGVRVLVQMDGAAHDRVRRLMNPSFAPASINRLQAGVTAAVDTMLDAIEAGGPLFDAPHDYTEPVVVEAMLTVMLGLPPEHKDIFLEVHRVIPQITYLTPGDPHPEECVRAFDNARQLIYGIVDDRRVNPRENDIITDLIQARDGGDMLTHEEMFDQIFTLCVAAFAGTTNAFTSALYSLYSNPAAVAELKADPALIPGAINECLRWRSSYLAFPRFAQHDTEVGGTEIRKGMIVRVSPQAAHFDPDVYPDPLRFDIHRNAKNIAFGSGPHHCIGHFLARLALRTAIERFMARFPNARLADPDMQLRYGGAIGELRIMSLPMLTH